MSKGGQHHNSSPRRHQSFTHHLYSCGVSLEQWGKQDEDSGRAKRMAGAYAIAAVTVAVLLAVGVAFGGQIRKRVVQEEVTVKFVPPEPVKEPEPEPEKPKPKPKMKKKVQEAPAALGRTPPPRVLPTDPPPEVDPSQARDAVEFEGYGREDGVKGGKGFGPGGVKTEEKALVRRGRAIALPENAKPPVPLRKAMPSYPERARKEGIQTVVVVKYVVTEDGRVISPKIIKGHPMFNALVLSAIRKWSYTPARLDGRPIRITRLAKFPFKLRT